MEAKSLRSSRCYPEVTIDDNFEAHKMPKGLGLSKLIELMSAEFSRYWVEALVRADSLTKRNGSKRNVYVENAKKKRVKISS